VVEHNLHELSTYATSATSIFRPFPCKPVTPLPARVGVLSRADLLHILDLTVLWIAFCLTGPISLCLDSFVCMYYFLSDYIACMRTV